MQVLYAKPAFGREEVEAVVRVLENPSRILMTGSEVARFESGVADLFGKQFGLMVNSGSSANLLAVAALGIEEGSEVITPALTFSTTVAPLLQRGLVPALVDVEADTFNIDVAQIEELIGPRTSAMMIPNLIGNLPDWSAVREIANRHGLKVIEDSADTLGATFGGNPTGSYSDISTTSFYASHIITAGGFGGMLVTDDSAAEEHARLLRGWGRSSSILSESEAVDDRLGVFIGDIEYDAKFLFSEIGYNFLPSEMGAAFGNVQLERLADFSRRRADNFAALKRFFAGFEEWFVLPRRHEEADAPWLALPLVVRPGAPFTRRDLQAHFETAGIQTRVIFTGNILRQPAFAGMSHREHPRGYPNADAVTRGGILLGCHQGMSEDEISYITETFDEFAADR